MNRRALARRNSLLTFMSQPWTLCEEGGAGDGGTGGGGAGNQGPQLNEHGYPDATPVADMAPEQAAAYWKHQSRKHEARANAVPTAAELETLRAAAAELATRKAAELSETERLQAEAATEKARADAAEAVAAKAAADVLRLSVAATKSLTPEQAARLQGSTREELEADADALKALFAPAGAGTGSQGTGTAPRSGGNRGNDVNGSTPTTTTGAELYRARHGKN